MNLPARLRRVSLAPAPRAARPSAFARLVAALAFAACFAALAPAARAIEIQVEVAFDSLAQPPAELSNVCTLRKAVNNANDNDITYPQCQGGEASPVVDTIVFNISGPITLSLGGTPEDGGESGDLDVTDDLTIIGHPDGTTIDAADIGRVFHVHPGVTLTLINIHITNGNENSGGGGVYVSNATLNLNGVTVSSCHTEHADGGGIFADNSTLNIMNSTISGNTNVLIGAGMAVQGGTTNITNSTITANHNLTGLAGGINAGGTVNLRSSILAGNTNDSLADTSPNFTGPINSLGYNIIGHLGTPPYDAPYTPHPTDQVGVTDAQLNLGPLQNNGGPTPTHAPGAGSVAIDKGHSTGATADQRGLTRPCDLAAVANAADGDGSDSGAVEVQGVCSAAPAPPDAVNDNAVVLEDSGANAINVLANDTDANFDVLTVVAVTQGANGSVAITGGGTGVSYTPNPDYFGGDSFTYTIDDGNGGQDTATVTVNVSNVNDAPVANNDNYSMNQDTTLTVLPATGVLANDTDIDDVSFTAVLVNGPSNAFAFGLNADGSFSYTPLPGFTGVDTFDYVANDGDVDSNLATVTITVNDTQAPVVTCSVTKALLWPPNSDLVNVGLTVTATDNDAEAPVVEIDVFSDEDDEEQLDGMSPDAKDVAPVTLRLRAERRGDANGRVYVIRIKATDQSNNTSYSYCTVVVPKSQSKADLSAVNAQAAAAVAAFVANGNNPPAGYFLVGDGPVVGPKQ
ncbi:MAG TPA: cadherin-like domain-containing protein [Pyrinomonadaceae bacterium]